MRNKTVIVKEDIIDRLKKLEIENKKLKSLNVQS